jgi:DNA polymerase (family 10)
MLRIPRIPPAKVLQIHRELGVASIEELEAACRADRLKARKGLGASLQGKILAGIELMRQAQGRRLIHQAAELLRAAEASLKRSHPELSGVAAAGDYRRGCELVSELALAAEVPEGQATRVMPIGEEIALWLAEPRRYGAALMFATGNAAHVAALQGIAEERGLRLDRDGLHRGKRLLPCPNEAEVYAALGLPFIAPELREGRGEIELARAGRLPELVTESDLRGLLHCHTDFSDGGNTLGEMAEATRRRGYGYFGVADHSRSAGYAGGLTVERVEEQQALADAVNRRYRGEFRIFKGIESDILQDGSLDYPDEVLGRFDFVVASVHGRFRLDPKAQTERIIRAVSNPHTTILGHMTGRLLLRREGYEVDVERILKACAGHGVAVEINANPHRLDLDWRWHARALELGCMMSINPDAHSIAELDLTRWGVAMARKGSVPKERVLNCLDREGLARHFEERKPRPGKARRAGTRARARSA